MKRIVSLATAATFLCLATSAFAAGDEQHGPAIDVKQTPAPVQATLQKEGGQVSKIERETEGGSTFYEATVSKDGKNYRLHIADDGKIMKRESGKDKK